jgi:SDR family mycofactocin-dependent oxidoreductase
MTDRLAGRVAFITGAARGQGRSHAIKLAEEGADIIAVDICAQIGTVQYPMATRDELDRTAEAVDTVGRRIVTIEADVRDADGVSAALEHGVGQLGGLDIVVANAGIWDFAPDLDGRVSDEAWRTLLDVDLTGVWNTVTAAVPHLRAQGGGCVIITSSVLGLRGSVNAAHYVAAKHGAVGLMRSMAMELGPSRIRVNAVHPTTVNTPMFDTPATRRLFRPDLADPSLDDVAAEARSLHLLPVPWVEPIDVSNAVAFLASDDARYITGLSLPVDAGATIK